MPLQQDRLCVHQVTLLKQCDFAQSVEAFARNGIFKTAVWREKLDSVGVEAGAKLLRDAGVEAVSLCAGGFLTARDPAASQKALDDNRRWIEQTAAIGASSLVVITGGLQEGDRDLSAARQQALEGFAQLIPDARAAGIRLALEPLHPMVCGFRSVLSSLREANDWLDSLSDDETMGIAFDSYALWWEDGLEAEIARAGPRLINFHVSDWLPDTRDLRLDRGMPGDGRIDNRQLRSWIEAQGYDGPVEVEIFSERNWWRREPDEVLQVIKERCGTAL